MKTSDLLFCIIGIHFRRSIIKVPPFPGFKIACGHFKTSRHDEDDVHMIALPEHYGRLDATRHFIARATGNSMDGGKNPSGMATIFFAKLSPRIVLEALAIRLSR